MCSEDDPEIAPTSASHNPTTSTYENWFTDLLNYPASQRTFEIQPSADPTETAPNILQPTSGDFTSIDVVEFVIDSPFQPPTSSGTSVNGTCIDTSTADATSTVNLGEFGNLLREAIALRTQPIVSAADTVETEAGLRSEFEVSCRKRHFSDVENDFVIETSSDDSNVYEVTKFKFGQDGTGANFPEQGISDLTLLPSKRVCLTPGNEATESSLPLSRAETGDYDSFDDEYSISASSISEGEIPAGALSPDLENIDITPIIKSELKDAIKSRRKKKGLPEISVTDEPHKPDKLTSEEEEKRLQRRERNRFAAAKCRKKKREVAEEKIKKAEETEKQNLSLLNEMEELLKTKIQLKEILQNHLKECKFPHLCESAESFLQQADRRFIETHSTEHTGEHIHYTLQM